MRLKNKKTGEIGLVHCDATMFSNKIGVFIDNNHIDLHNPYKIYTSLAELNEEWEDYNEEPKEYWFINDLDGEPMKCELQHCPVRSFTEWSEKRKQIGNYFETSEEAEKAVEKLKAWKRLKDKRFQFHGHNALGFGEITFSLDFEDMDDEGEIGQLRHDLDLLFSGEDD